MHLESNVHTHTHIKLNFNQKNLLSYLRKRFGNKDTAEIAYNLIYWSLKDKYKKGFYKFMEPCKHPLYKKGDSWTEVISISRKKVKNCMKALVTHYKTKGGFVKAEDKFQGSLFASYVDRKKNQTFYIPNEDLVGDLLKSYEKGLESPLVYKKPSLTAPNIGYPPPMPVDKSVDNPVDNSTFFDPPDRPCVGTFGHPFACASRSNTSNSIDTSLKPNDQSKQHASLVVKQMVDIWNTITKDSFVFMESMTVKLSKAFQEYFHGKIEKWRDYCYKIASSKFCVGEAPNSTFKAYLWWVIKPDTIQKIMQGAYGVGQKIVERLSIFETEEEKLKKELSKKINKIDIEIEQNERKIKTYCEGVYEEQRRQRIKDIYDHIGSLTDEERNVYRKIFDAQGGGTKSMFNWFLMGQIGRFYQDYSIENIEIIEIPPPLLAKRWELLSQKENLFQTYTQKDKQDNFLIKYKAVLSL